MGGERGYDSGKQEVKETKRHLLVDTQGLVLKAKAVHPANVFDRDGIKPLLEHVYGSAFSASLTSCGWMLWL